ncbi:30S ribosomal protein S20 [Candidatus Aerophobetes bacterium]|uniref:Small ribosomal subunit protein bS20 n=1 Tax=Aerophobetes bacterium TaxID=2030807 RepID=A0A662D076_UNCAE|nr:MAG: 30S ribosomal protein S20 [Candidatus Aerophobetes bacterium]
MGKSKSAEKRARQDQIKKERNRSRKRQAKTSIRKIKELVSEGKLEEAKKLLPHTLSIIDKTASKGAWHPNKASREKSKLMKTLK